MVLASNEVIKAEDLPAEVRGGGVEQVELNRFVTPGTSLPEAVEEFEQYLIKRALARADYVQSHAAEMLGVSKSNLQYKLKKYDIHPSPDEAGKNS